LPLARNKPNQAARKISPLARARGRTSKAPSTCTIWSSGIDSTIEAAAQGLVRCTPGGLGLLAEADTIPGVRAGRFKGQVSP